MGVKVLYVSSVNTNREQRKIAFEPPNLEAMPKGLDTPTGGIFKGPVKSIDFNWDLSWRLIDLVDGETTPKDEQIGIVSNGQMSGTSSLESPGKHDQIWFRLNFGCSSPPDLFIMVSLSQSHELAALARRFFFRCFQTHFFFLEYDGDIITFPQHLMAYFTHKNSTMGRFYF